MGYFAEALLLLLYFILELPLIIYIYIYIPIYETAKQGGNPSEKVMIVLEVPWVKSFMDLLL